GGAIVVWQDDRNGNLDLYAQRISSLGTAQWNIDGGAVCTATGDQRVMGITRDEVNGAIVVWEDDRAGSTATDIYVQRISEQGAMLWTANGVAVCNAVNQQVAPTLVGDELSGTILT